MTGDRPESVWLATTGAIAGADVAQGPQGERIGNTVIVQSAEDVWRVTEIPSFRWGQIGARGGYVPGDVQSRLGVRTTEADRTSARPPVRMR